MWDKLRKMFEMGVTSPLSQHFFALELCLCVANFWSRSRHARSFKTWCFRHTACKTSCPGSALSSVWRSILRFWPASEKKIAGLCRWGSHPRCGIIFLKLFLYQPASCCRWAAEEGSVSPSSVKLMQVLGQQAPTRHTKILVKPQLSVPLLGPFPALRCRVQFQNFHRPFFFPALPANMPCFAHGGRWGLRRVTGHPSASISPLLHDH